MSSNGFLSAVQMDRGKRMVSTDASTYRQSDFLYDYRSEREKRVSPVGVSDVRATKFSSGFYRRPVDVIQPHAEREARDAERAEQAALHQQRRTEYLAAVNARNGNVVSPAAANEKLFPARRHYSTLGESIATQNHQRQKHGASRFHVELTAGEQEHRDREIARRLNQQRQATSDIGFGRKDLITHGVVDNFRDARSSPQEVISKPKTKPPPPDIEAAKRSRGGFLFSDGSQPSEHPLGRTRLDAIIHSPAPQTQSATSNAAASARTIQRSAKNNATSSGLREALSFSHGPPDADRWSRSSRAVGAGAQQQQQQSQPS